MAITKGERTELRSLIRQRMKVLRAEVDQRQAELEAELVARIRERFAAGDKAWDDAFYLVQEAAREANRKANDIMRSVVADWPVKEDRNMIGTYPIERPKSDRNAMRLEGHKRIAAQVKSALLRLDQQEADLLTRLIAGALESEEARAFLGEIPTVSALVPTDRLLELEQSLRDDAR